MSDGNPHPPAPPPNKALKLTRLAACLLGGPASEGDHAMQRGFPSPAVQLSAGVRQPDASIVVAFAFLLASLACTPAPPPVRPDGVPPSAVWAGGPDGGSWVLCRPSESELSTFHCTAYNDFTGDVAASGRFVLTPSTTATTRGDRTSSASAAEVPAIAGFDGIKFFLKDNAVLVPHGWITTSFGNGHGKKVQYSMGEQVGEEVEF